MKKKWLMATAALALVSCSSDSGDTADHDAAVDAGEADEADLLAPVDGEPLDEAPLLGPVSTIEIEAELEPGAGCSVEADGKALLVAVEGDAIAHPYGTLRHFTFAGDADALRDGGVFTAGAITITVRPGDGEGEQIGDVLVKPARVTVREEGQAEQGEIAAEWHCGT